MTVVASRERAAQQLAAFTQPEAPACIATFVNTAIKSTASGPGVPAGVTFGNAEVEQLDLPGLNTDGVAYRATMPVTAEGQTIDFFLDIVLALKGRTGISMTFVGFQTPFTTDFETSLINTIIDRAPAD